MSDRREFFQGVASGAAGVAILAAATQMGVPILNAAQDGGAKPDSIGGASAPKPTQGGEAKPSAKAKTESSFFRDPPPWPKGTDGHIYDHLFGTKIRENTIVPDIIPGPQAYFRGEPDLPGAKINMGWQILTKPYVMERESHHHDVDEYLFFLGATFPDLVGTFDAEIEFFVGPEFERHIINQATIFYVPAGLEHNPSDFRRIGKPLFFSALQLAPFFNSVYQTMGYMAMKTSNKIDLKGNPIK